MTEPVIRPETPADHDAIRRVVAEAFESDAEADLVEAIRTSPEYVAEMALVATIGTDVVGHVMISGALLQTVDGDRPIVMLSPLAVGPTRQRQGIGSALVRAVTAVAERRGEPLVVLEGGPAFYGRLGFEPSAPLGIHIDLPDWAPPEAAQVMRLTAYDGELRGNVISPPAFDSF
ncbi:MAG: N-acetyltransferase [Ilumatobacter sp.]|nr:N-acetyltransferase [Ilumatobacter sp.]